MNPWLCSYCSILEHFANIASCCRCLHLLHLFFDTCADFGASVNFCPYYVEDLKSFQILFSFEKFSDLALAETKFIPYLCTAIGRGLVVWKTTGSNKIASGAALPYSIGGGRPSVMVG